MDKQKENKVVELSDEDLAKVVGGVIKINNDNSCAACTPTSSVYKLCDIRKVGNSYCKYVQ